MKVYRQRRLTCEFSATAIFLKVELPATT